MEEIIDYNKLLRSIAAGRQQSDESNGSKVLTQQSLEAVPQKTYEFVTEYAISIKSIIVQAALSGWFAPGDLDVGKSSDRKLLPILQELHKYCIIGEDQPQRWWLEKDTRISVLNDLIDNNHLLSTLAGDLPETDKVGLCLREILANQVNLDLANKAIDELLNYSLALEALDGLNILKPDLAQLKQRIEKNNFLTQQGVLNLELFIGRVKELGQLVAFANEDASSNTEIVGLILAGAGGAGKSALLNKFHYQLFNYEHVATAQIDFDRPGMDPKDTLWLETEIIKQVQLQFSLAVQLGDEWNEVWINKLANAEYYQEEVETQKRAGRNFLHSFRNIYLQDIIDLPKTWVIILDTFEEVIQRSLTTSIMDWLYDLQAILDPIRLKIIFSGRSLEESNGAFPIEMIKDVIKLNDFDILTSENFLKLLDVHPDTIRRLVRNKAIPKRPLELKLLAQLYHQEGENGIRQLEQDLANGGKNNKLYTGIIYRRVLLRLNRNELRKLAYPGLILRYLTADLIQQVLAPVLDLEPIDANKAIDLLHELAKYGWLAYLSGDKLWHRKDLRRAILQVMIANDPDTAKLLHIAAVDYFRHQQDENSKTEVFYHEMMLGEFVNLPHHEQELSLKTIEFNLQGDLFDFPKRSKIVFELKWRKRITRQQLDSLPKRYLPEGFDLLGRNYMETAQFGSALTLIRTLEKRGLQAFKQLEYPVDWQQETLFQTVNWDEINLNIRLVPTFDLVHDLNTILICMLKHGTNDPVLLDTFNRYLGSSDLLNQIERNPKYLNQMVGRLGVCVMLMKSTNRLDDHQAANVLQIVSFLRNMTSKYRSPELYRVILLLQFAAGERSFPNYLMTSAYAKLDLDWLEKRINRTSSGRINEKLGRIVQILNDFNSQESRWDQKRTPRTLLSALDRGGRGSQNYDSDFPAIDPPYTFQDIKGPFPEIRNLIKYALLSEFTGFDGAEELFQIFNNLIPYKFDVSAPAEFFEILRRRADKELSLYIEIIDRMWKLKDLIQAAISIKPYSEKLRTLLDFCEIWYNSYQYVWEHTY